MESIYIFFILIIVVMSALVMLNTYNVYRLTNVEYKKQNLLDMQEFTDLHPMIKELYKESIVNGMFYLQNMIVNDVIQMNDIDKWYNANRSDLLELIKVVKEKGTKYYNENGSNNLRLEPSTIAKLTSLDIPALTKQLKEMDNESEPMIQLNNIIETKDISNKLLYN